MLLNLSLCAIGRALILVGGACRRAGDYEYDINVRPVQSILASLTAANPGKITRYGPYKTRTTRPCPMFQTRSTAPSHVLPVRVYQHRFIVMARRLSEAARNRFNT